jgi:hypothetical protein
MYPAILRVWGQSLNAAPGLVKESVGLGYLPAKFTASRSLSMQKYSWISPPGDPS